MESIYVTMQIAEDLARDGSNEDALTLGQAVLMMAREKLGERDS